MYILMLSIHGLIRGHDLELGRDADTGGQTKYVVDLARALGERADVSRVDLVTRRVVDPAVSPDYAEPIEPLGDKARILRLDAGPEGYLPKEQLWDHLDGFVDNLTAFLHEQGQWPDIIHSHYADAGYVGSRLANLLIVAGNRDDIRDLDEGARTVLTDILITIDAHDLYGQVALPKHHSADEVPESYRLTARSGGVFINPALTEPFGLTLLEAAATGLPLVATENGGPVDIIGNCRNGLLVDPHQSRHRNPLQRSTGARRLLERSRRSPLETQVGASRAGRDSGAGAAAPDRTEPVQDLLSL